jgi:hypothetical protein
MNNYIKKFTKGFTAYQNSLIQNKEMDWQERGLLLFLLSLPDNFTICKTKLHYFTTDGRDASVNTFNRLVKLGYIKVIVEKEVYPYRVRYEIYDEPQEVEALEEPITENEGEKKADNSENTLITENQESVNEVSEKPVLLKKNKEINNINSVSTQLSFSERFKIYQDANYSDTNYIVLKTGLDSGIIIVQHLFLGYVNTHQQVDIMGWRRNYENVRIEDRVVKFFKENNAQHFNDWSHVRNSFKRYMRQREKKSDITPVRQKETPKEPEMSQEIREAARQRAANRF